MSSINNIHQKLGLDTSNGLRLLGDNDNNYDKRLSKLFADTTYKPHSIFYLADKPFILFYDNPVEKKVLFRTIWNINEVPVIIVSEAGQVTIYNGFEFLKDEYSLSILANENSLSDFEYFKLVTGQTWEKYETQLSYRNRVDFKLLENIKAARSILTENCGLNNHTANALLGKTIFSRYLIDRHVRIGFQSDPAEWTTDDFCRILSNKKDAIKFFKYLENKFKGNLFEFEDAKIIEQSALNIITDLLNGVQIGFGQLSLFDIYDFSIIPVEFISNVYEMFIGEKEQAQSGSYYTPLFLVDYITSQTTKKYFSSEQDVRNCIVLDPACGSGIFLVESLRILIERYNSLFPNISRGTKVYRDNIIKIAKHNIYGIDKDESAINVAIFSIYLTLLDYQKPRDIENFEFPTLIDENFFVADFFNTTHVFNTILAKIEFDFIVGNPPWKRGGGKNNVMEPYEEYIKNRRLKEHGSDISINISNKEIAQAFLLRISDFVLRDKTQVAFIVTSKILYNLNASEFRRYLLKNFFIDRVFELSPVRKEVFDKSNDPSVAPAAIIFYRFANGQETRRNHIEHFSVKPNRFFSLFKIFLIQRNDVKSVLQSFPQEHDWLWKVLLYGNFNDFYFIKRLKETYTTISNEADNRDCLVGQGVIINGNRKLQDSSHLVGKLFVRTKEDIEPFIVVTDPKVVWIEKLALYPRSPELYKAPLLLITEGISPEFKAVAAIHYKKDIVFKSSLTAIRSDDVEFLETVCGYLNSTLFSYYALITTSSAGVEREQTHDKEKLGFPYKDTLPIAELVRQLHGIKRKMIKAKTKILSNDFEELKSEFQKVEASLDKTVLKAFELTDVEKSLVDYGVRFVIPSIMKTNIPRLLLRPIGFEDKYLEAYINVFIEKFKDSLGSPGKQFNVEVWHSDQIIGIIFKVEKLQNGKPSLELEWIKKETSFLLKKIVLLGHSRISDRLFMQKDIRGFEKDSFYIFKPNEKKVWHKAMAYLDLNDFVDAILKTGKDV